MRFLPVLIAAFLITGVASAQHGNPGSGLVTLGVKGGLNYYNINQDDNTNFDQRTGYNIGILGHIHINSTFAFQPELVYSAQGAKGRNLDYINVPLLIQYMFDNGFRIQAGPQIGFLVSSDNDHDYNPLDLALSVGVSYVVPSSGFGIDLRYNHGLSDIYKSSELKGANRGIQLGLFYLFGHTSGRAF
ncbi:MAG: porin family protein [Bacteroidales bacterium]|nr:porin family protein [Bacteroidales bacterium]